MSTILIRLFIIYFLTVFSFKLMGKRQVGELQLSELVCAIFISELATFPVGDKSTPLLYGITPILFLVSVEVIISYATTKWRTVKRAFDQTPDFLIVKGMLKPKALSNARITVEELLSELRQQGVGGPHEVEYALLEPNGKISVLKRGCADMDRALIIDGRVNVNALSFAGKTQAWLEHTVKKQGFKNISEVFLLTLSDSGQVYSVKKEE